MKLPHRLWLLATVALLIPVAVLATPNEVSIGFGTAQDGPTVIARGGHEKQQLASAVGADLGEAARLGQLYTITTASAGTSFTTAGASPLAAGGTAWLALYNPSGSGYNLEIETVTIGLISGTPGVGAQAYNLGCNQTITAAQNATPVGSLSPLQSGVGRGYTQTALTGSGLLTLVGVSPYAPFAAAAAGVVNVSVVDNINGRFIVAPGCVFAIETTAAGTTHIAVGSITYRQAVP